MFSLEKFFLFLIVVRIRIFQLCTDPNCNNGTDSSLPKVPIFTDPDCNNSKLKLLTMLRIQGLKKGQKLLKNHNIIFTF